MSLTLISIWARNKKTKVQQTDFLGFWGVFFTGMRQCFDPEEPEDEEWDWPEAERR